MGTPVIGLDLRNANPIKYVEGLRRHIEASLGVTYEDQLIVHRGTLLLNNWAKLEDLGIVFIDGETAAIDLQVFTKIDRKLVDVVVKTENYDIEFQIHSGDTVLDMKSMIDKRIGVSPRRQVLKVLNIAMFDYTMIEDYVTCNPFQVELEETPKDPQYMIKINVMNAYNESKCLEVELGDTIYTLHGQIRKEELAQGYNFYLVWKGHRLHGDLTFSQCKIAENDILYVKQL